MSPGQWYHADTNLVETRHSMKPRDANPAVMTNADTKEPQVSPAFSPSIVVWLLHWVSALLVLFLLATSLASGLGIAARVFPAAWMDWHLSAGIALFAVTIVRFRTSRSLRALNHLFAFNRPDAQSAKLALFAVVIIVVLSGLAIFQNPPFGRSGILFWVFPMPTLIRLDHSIHNVIIDMHIALSCIAAILLLVHIIAGLRRVGMGGQSRLAAMLWPWH